MSDPQPIRFSVPEAEFDLALLPEAARERGSQAFRQAVTNYYKDACPASTPLADSRQPSWPVSAPRLSPATTWGRRHEN